MVLVGELRGQLNLDLLVELWSSVEREGEEEQWLVDTTAAAAWHCCGEAGSCCFASLCRSVCLCITMSGASSAHPNRHSMAH